LMGSIPVLGKVKEKLEVIPGMVPNLVDLPPGCRFAPRCRQRKESYPQEVEPELLEVAPGHKVRCWLYEV
jgi:peptide/nickel transport system ATP-binding protein